MKKEARENLLYRYLLGELPEEEQTALERQFLADRDRFDEAWAVENKLIDNYVRGELAPADRERFENHYLASSLHRERVSVAEAFLKNIDDSNEAPEENSSRIEIAAQTPALGRYAKFLDSISGRGLGFATAMAGALALAICVAGWLAVEKSRLTDQLAQTQTRSRAEVLAGEQRERELARQKQKLEEEVARERGRAREQEAEIERLRRERGSGSPSDQPQTQTPGVPAFFSFLLAPAPTRDKNGAPPTTVPIIKGDVRLLMPLPGDDYSGYQASLQTVEGREILSAPANKIRAGKDRAFAAVTIPAGKLIKGDYILTLSGRAARGGLQEIDQYVFRAQ
jgi:anti-sigma factor RsiW